MSAGLPDWEALMQQAIDLALHGRGHVEPNPRVGALALEDGRVVGRGFHRYWGGPHAESEALQEARSAGARPDTMVVTLEPCSTPLGVDGKKTPPCTELLLASGVRRVVVGATDLDPRHRGTGLAVLEQQGIEVVDGVLASRCKAINRPFVRWLGLDRPWTLAKFAMTLDGKTAAPTGESRWISGPESLRRTHELRARVDAVVVGFRTARADDPELTVRHVEGPQPLRIVVDPFAELPEENRLLRTAQRWPLLVLVHETADPVRVARFTELGAEVLRIKPAEGGRRLHLLDAWRALRRRGVRRVMVEGGGNLCAQLLAWDCIDQVLAFVAPKMIGGRHAPTPLAGEGKAFMAEAWRYEEMYWEPSGDDLMIGAFRPSGDAPPGRI